MEIRNSLKKVLDVYGLSESQNWIDTNDLDNQKLINELVVPALDKMRIVISKILIVLKNDDLDLPAKKNKITEEVNSEDGIKVHKDDRMTDKLNPGQVVYMGNSWQLFLHSSLYEDSNLTAQKFAEELLHEVAAVQLYRQLLEKDPSLKRSLDVLKPLLKLKGTEKQLNGRRVRSGLTHTTHIMDAVFMMIIRKTLK